MIKTNIDNIAKPALPLIMFGVLKGYIKRPMRGFKTNKKISSNFFNYIKINKTLDYQKTVLYNQV
jgi:hypothetical protein